MDALAKLGDREPITEPTVEDLPQDLHFNMRLDEGLLASLKQAASERRVAYHALARALIRRTVDKEWERILPQRKPLDLQSLLVLLLNAKGPRGRPHEPISSVTAVDKLLFLVSRSIPPGLRPAFEPFHYGPWDETLADTEVALRSSGLLSEPSGAPDPDQPLSYESLAAVAKRKTQREALRQFALTRRGIAAAERWKESQNSLTSDEAEALLHVVESIKQRYGALSNEELTAEVYRRFPAYASRSKIRDRINRRSEGRKPK
jgi:hypothetical protein